MNRLKLDAPWLKIDLSLFIWFQAQFGQEWTGICFLKSEHLRQIIIIVKYIMIKYIMIRWKV